MVRRMGNKKFSILVFGLIFLLVFSGLLFFDYNSRDGENIISDSGEIVQNNLFDRVKNVIGANYFEDVINKLTGFVVDESEVSGDEAVEENTVEEPTEIVEEEVENPVETEVGEAEVVSDEVLLSEISEANETVAEENIILIDEILADEIPTNETIINETLINETIEINETVLNETIINETIVNETVLNETIEINETLVNETILNKGDLNVTTLQYKAVIGRPVKWIKVVRIENKSQAGNLELELPKKAENITIKTGDEVRDALDSIEKYKDVVEKTGKRELVGGAITGYASFDIEESRGLLARFFNWLRSWTVSGNVILLSDDDSGEPENETEEYIIETDENKIVDLENVVKKMKDKEIAVEYWTPGPVAVEANLTEHRKTITVSGDDKYNYTDILAYSLVSGFAKMGNAEAIKLYHWDENSGQEGKDEINFSAYDLDSDGYVDYIEWVVPHLSEQVYEIVIEITKADHLDENRNFISDIYDYVEAKDGNWSEAINNAEYVRVTFEQELDNTRDITIYARGSGSIEVYEKDGDGVIAEFTEIVDEGWYKVYLTNLVGQQDVFDLKVLGGVEFDYIVDPDWFNSSRMYIREHNSIVSKNGFTKEYKAENKSLKMYSEDTSIEMELLSSYNTIVGAGENVKVAEIKLKDWQGKDNLFDELGFYDRENWNKENKNFVLKYAEEITVQTEMEFPSDFPEEAKDNTLFEKVVGDWDNAVEFTKLSELPHKDIRIGIFYKNYFRRKDRMAADY
ncbi:MAG: hypothetical protein ABIF18_03080 [archaeon]